MKKFMSDNDYNSFLKEWGDVNSDVEGMQKWVDKVRFHIGVDAYETIKSEFRREETDRSIQENTLHCTQTFAKSSEVKFKEDVGADLTIEEDLDSFKKMFQVVLHGILSDDEI